MGSTYLNSATELFDKSGYKDKKKKVLEKLNRIVQGNKLINFPF